MTSFLSRTWILAWDDCWNWSLSKRGCCRTKQVSLQYCFIFVIESLAFDDIQCSVLKSFMEFFIGIIYSISNHLSLHGGKNATFFFCPSCFWRGKTSSGFVSQRTCFLLAPEGVSILLWTNLPWPVFTKSMLFELTSMKRPFQSLVIFLQLLWNANLSSWLPCFVFGRNNEFSVQVKCSPFIFPTRK